MKLVYVNIIMRLFVLFILYLFVEYTSFNSTLDIIEYIILAILFFYYFILSLYELNFYYIYMRDHKILNEYTATLYLIKFVTAHYVYRVYVSRYIFENVDLVTVRYVTGLRVMLVIDPYRKGLSAGLVPSNDIIENIDNL